MKKTLIAMAVLAAAGAASAQSSVTLYGRLDLGLSNSSTETTGATTTETSDTNLFGANDSNTSSRLGVTGTEDLGGGKTAFFTYELNIEPDNGDAAGTTRIAQLGMKGSFGSVVIGTLYNAIDDTRGFGAEGISNFAGDAAGAAGEVGGTSSNALHYVTPTMSGFTGKLTVSNDSSDTTTGGATTAEAKNSQAVLGVQYAGHGASVQLAYATEKADTLTSENSKTDLLLGLGYSTNLGSVSVTPSMLYETTTGDVAGVETDSTYIGLSSGFSVGAFGPWVTFGTGTNESGTTENSVTGFEVGTDYSISKRTSVYGAYNSKAVTTEVAGVETGEVTTNNLVVGLVHKF